MRLVLAPFQIVAFSNCLPCPFCQATEHRKDLDMTALDQAAKAEAAAARWKSKAKKSKNEDVWMSDHAETFREKGLQWPPEWGKDKQLKANVQFLVPRMQEAAYYHVHRPRGETEVPCSLFALTTLSAPVQGRQTGGSPRERAMPRE